MKSSTVCRSDPYIFSPQAKFVLDAVLAVKEKIVELIPKFQPLAEEVMELAKKSSEVFTEPTEKIKAAFGEEADFVVIGKAVAAATGNLKTAATEPVKIVSTLKDTIMRLSDELQAAITEIKALFPAASA